MISELFHKIHSRFKHEFLYSSAKINLYLGVHEGRDSEGFHRVDSLTACLDVFDTVVLEDAEELSVTCVPPVGIMQEHNTCWHAARAMEREFGRSANVAIRVEKHIPDQAGLGASSSDAAAVIWRIRYCLRRRISSS